jgi:hypothetical protein
MASHPRADHWGSRAASLTVGAMCVSAHEPPLARSGWPNATERSRPPPKVAPTVREAEWPRTLAQTTGFPCGLPDGRGYVCLCARAATGKERLAKRHRTPQATPKVAPTVREAEWPAPSRRPQAASMRPPSRSGLCVSAHEPRLARRSGWPSATERPRPPPKVAPTVREAEWPRALAQTTAAPVRPP